MLKACLFVAALFLVACSHRKVVVQIRSYDTKVIEWTDLTKQKELTSTCTGRVTVYHPTSFTTKDPTCGIGSLYVGHSIPAWREGYPGLAATQLYPSLVLKIDYEDRAIIETFSPVSMAKTTQ